MDRAEAIYRLRVMVVEADTKEDIQALDLAIEALQEPSVSEKESVDGDAESATTTEDCISRQAAMEALQNPDGCTDLGTNDLFLSMGMTVKRILSLPPVTPPERTGEWLPIIEATEMGESYIAGIYCSECGETLGFEANYCPNCGAKMGGDTE